jgi:hypothetical protein
MLLPYIVACWFGANGQTIPVRVCNESLAGEREILEMTRTAETVFQHSGIHLRWLECSSDSEPDFALSLNVTNSSKAVSSRALGFTVPNSSRVRVLFSKAKDICIGKGIRVNPGRIMGYAATHEIFHAVLRTGDHASQGIMKAAYGYSDLVRVSQGTLFFTPEQTRLLRSELSVDHVREMRDLIASDR